MKLPWPRTHDEYLEWFSAITGFIAAIIISSNIGLTGYGYVLFLASSVSLIYVSIYLKRWGLLAMGVGYTMINLWGIWRWLLVFIL